MNIKSNLFGIIEDAGGGRFAVFIVLLFVLFSVFILTLSYALYISKKVNEEDQKKVQLTSPEKEFERVLKADREAKAARKKTAVKMAEPKTKKPKVRVKTRVKKKVK